MTGCVPSGFSQSLTQAPPCRIPADLSEHDLIFFGLIFFNIVNVVASIQCFGSACEGEAMPP